MALPKINEHLKFTMEIPSTGKKVKYRPYLVKEEKILLQAFESQSMEVCLEAMCDTLESCIESKQKVDVASLPTFDLEYMFLQVRSKSVGETSDIMMKCKNEDCKEENRVNVDLSAVEVDYNRNDSFIEITDGIKIEMTYPRYKSLVGMQEEEGKEEVNMDGVVGLLRDCMVAVHTEDERIDCSEQSKEELDIFISSMTSTQLQKLTSFLENMPALKHDVAFKCTKCGTMNEVHLKGLADFF